ncbi:unnamed protein product [Caenorhabditis nigoni]
MFGRTIGMCRCRRTAEKERVSKEMSMYNNNSDKEDVKDVTSNWERNLPEGHESNEEGAASDVVTDVGRTEPMQQRESKGVQQRKPMMITWTGRTTSDNDTTAGVMSQQAHEPRRRSCGTTQSTATKINGNQQGSASDGWVCNTDDNQKGSCTRTTTERVAHRRSSTVNRKTRVSDSSRTISKSHLVRGAGIDAQQSLEDEQCATTEVIQREVCKQTCQVNQRQKHATCHYKNANNDLLQSHEGSKRVHSKRNTRKQLSASTSFTEQLWIRAKEHRSSTSTVKKKEVLVRRVNVSNHVYRRPRNHGLEIQKTNAVLRCHIQDAVNEGLQPGPAQMPTRKTQEDPRPKTQ